MRTAGPHAEGAPQSIRANSAEISPQATAANALDLPW